MPRRKVSSKPVKGYECKFRIHLRLLPGHSWRIAYTTKDTSCHNHLMLQKEELNIPSSRLTPDEKQIGASAMKFSGSGAAQNMMTDLSYHTLSAQQLGRVREGHEDDGTTKPSLAAWCRSDRRVHNPLLLPPSTYFRYSLSACVQAFTDKKGTRFRQMAYRVCSFVTSCWT
jgi:hypothetical protein